MYALIKKLFMMNCIYWINLVLYLDVRINRYSWATTLGCHPVHEQSLGVIITSIVVGVFTLGFYLMLCITYKEDAHNI